MITIDNVRIDPEGDYGQQTATFTVTLQGAFTGTVSVDWATSDGNTTAGNDYIADAGTLTWTVPGEQTLTVKVLGDTIDESDEENFFIDLTNPVGALIYDDLGEGRIVDDDDPSPASFAPAVCSGGSTLGAIAPLAIGTGDGSLSIAGITADGRISPWDASYDPIGAVAAADTIYSSYISYRAGTSGPRTPLDATSAQMIGDLTQLESNFVQDGLDMQLCQQVRPLLDGQGATQGSLLAQTLQVSNPGSSSVSFELVRYLDGDLLFDGSLIDGGGRLVTANGGVEILFETDSGGSGTNDTTFVGITSLGGSSPWSNRWEMDEYDSLELDILAGNALTDTIYQDLDGDSFVDVGLEYDIELGLRNTFYLAGGATVEYTTHTLFGTGAPSDVTPPTPPTPPPSPPPTSETEMQGDTLNGGNGNDTLLGSEMADILRGGTARDLIYGGGGDDTILGQGGRDTIDGGEGDDEIHGNAGNDVITGGAGDDHLVWSPGEANDTPSGGAGFDTLEIEGSSGDDNYTITKTPGGGAQIQITDGSHRLTLGSSIEVVTLTLGDGNDTVNIEDLKGVTGTLLAIYGEGGNDTLTAVDSRVGTVRVLLDGGDGNDTITGSDGNDSLYGGDGNDLLLGGDGDDTIEAGLGDDLLYGNAGNDVLDGEDGNDTIEGNTGNDILWGGEGDDSLVGGSDDDSVYGGEGDDKLNGQQGNDELYGGIGADTLAGGSGDDLLDGGLNDDRMLGNDGDDTMRGDDGDDELHGHDGDDLIGGGDGNDSITGDSGADLINGGDGDDNINSGGSDDTIVGGDGNDTLFGGAGRDIVLGENGNDRVFGQGSVHDTIAGGEGSDQLIGLASEIDEAFTVDASVRALLDSV
jgi:Ca2+-binding RTX toxin-like protein